MSGMILEEGICDLRIYLLRSGSWTLGQGATGAGGGHADVPFLQPQGRMLPHEPQTGEPSNPSAPPTRTRRPSFAPTLYMNPAVPAPPTKRANRPIIKTCMGVNFITLYAF